ncbi:hypothetical protein JOD64_005939 [Micromonospora luteifusca]|uniref:Uncharacterized protein n=1 Tax=Micromonospora luteifusca TaxID=709860 RepID=A0ABS2M2Q4_9ACTN|nr:hypothetical protein [Micromonospora luteifusca]
MNAQAGVSAGKAPTQSLDRTQPLPPIRLAKTFVNLPGAGP